MAEANRAKASTGHGAAKPSTHPPRKPSHGGRPGAATTSHPKAAIRPTPPGPSVPAAAAAAAGGTTTVLPRIERRGSGSSEPAARSNNYSEIANSSSLAMAISPQNRKVLVGFSRSSLPDSEARGAALGGSEPSPTMHSPEPIDTTNGPPAKAAWCTPRSPLGSHLELFFATARAEAAQEDADERRIFEGSDAALTTPARLQSVEVRLRESDELFRIDLDTLLADNDKFFEVAGTAAQHVEGIQRELPRLASAFEETTSALSGLSRDIAALHERHEHDKDKMLEQLDRVFNQGTDEKVALAEAQEAEKHELQLTHEREVARLEAQFRDHMLELEAKYNVMEETCLDELQQLRASSAAQLAAANAKAERDLADLAASAQHERDALEHSLRSDLQDLTASSEAKLGALETKSVAEYEELQRSSSEEIRVLREASASQFAEATDALTRQLEALQQSKSDELAALRANHADEKTRVSGEYAREIAALKDELNATTATLSADVQELVRQHAQEREETENTNELAVKTLKSAHMEQLSSLRTAAAAELAQTVESFSEKLAQASEAHAAESARLGSDASATQTSLVERYEAELTQLRDESKRERDRLTLTYETEIDALKRSNLETLERAAKAHDTSITQLREAHAAKTLQLEAFAREQERKFAESLQTQSLELKRQQSEICALESKFAVLDRTHRSFVDSSQQLVARCEMDACERDARMLAVQRELCGQLATLEQTRWELRAAGEDQRVKGNTILELTFVVKSRDDEVERLRSALLDSVKSVNQKTEILELTAETLSSKAKELEDTRAALRKESGRLSRVEESMHQKDEILEDTELKVENMRLSMENMRLEMKRMQMDMKLQLEHTEGEMELKNGEIGRLHAAQSELRSKSEFQQQSIARLEESLAQTKKHADDAQRRIHLLRLEATQSAEEAKKMSDALLERDQELLVLANERQSAVYDKQRAQIQLNHLAQVATALHEKNERQLMFCEEVQTRFLKVLAETSAEKDERLRAEKHLLLLELSATKELVRHLDGVETRLADSKRENEAQRSQLQSLRQELEVAVATAKKIEENLADARHRADELTTTRTENEHTLACTHDKLRFESEAAGVNIAALTGTVNELSARNTALTSAHDALVRKIEAMTNDHNTMTNEHEKLRKEHEALASECEQRHERASSLARQNEELTKAFSSEKMEMAGSLERMASDLDAAKQQFEAQLADAASELRAGEVAVERLEGEVARKTQENDKLQSTALALQHDVSDRRAENAVLVQEVSRLERALQDETADHLHDAKESDRELMLRSDELATLERDFADKLSAQAEEHARALRRTMEETRDAMNERHEAVLRGQQEAFAAQLQPQSAGLVGAEGEHEQLEEDHQYDTTSADRDAVRAVEFAQLRQERAALEQQLHAAAAAKSMCEKAHGEELARAWEAHEKEFADVRAAHAQELAARLTELEDTNARLAQDFERHAGSITEPTKREAELSLLEDTASRLARCEEQLAQTQRQLAETELQLVESTQLVAARTATVDSVRRELNSLHEASSATIATQPCDQLLARFRQQIDAHLWDAYQVDRAQIAGGGCALETEGDVLECLQNLFLMRCATLATRQKAMKSAGVSGGLVLSVSDVCSRLEQFDAIATMHDELFAVREPSSRQDVAVTHSQGSNAHEARALESSKATEILSFVRQSVDFVAHCRQALGLVSSTRDNSRSEVLDCICELMKVLQRFEGFQSSSSAPTNNCSSAIRDQVAAVLSFLDELHLMTDFAQSILDEESDVAASAGLQSGASSTGSLGAARSTLTRTPTPSSELNVDSGDGDEGSSRLQIEVPLPLDELELELQQHDDTNQAAFDDSEDNHMLFAVDDDDHFLNANGSSVGGGGGASAAPLTESLMDISLVMSDHHRVISEAAHWVKKTARLRRRRSSKVRPPADLGSEICRLVREHCALLSLAKKLFQLKDPRHDLSPLLECLAILRRLTSRLSVFQDDLGAANHNSVSSESLASATSVTSSTHSIATAANTSSHDSLLPSLSVFACLEDIARHLQDYDFFLQQMRDSRDKQRLSESVANVELFTQQLAGRLKLVAHAQSTLGLQNPMLELPKLLQSMRELIASTKRLDPWQATVVEQDVSDVDHTLDRAEAAREQARDDVDASSSGDGSSFVVDDAPADAPTEIAPELRGLEAYASAFSKIESNLAGYSALTSWLREVLPFARSVTSIDDLRDRVQEVLDQLEHLATTSVEMRDELELLRAERARALQQQGVEDAFLASHGVAMETESSPPTSGALVSRLELFQRLVEERRTLLSKTGDADASASQEASFLLQSRLLLEVTSGVERAGVHEQLATEISRLSTQERAWEADIRNERSVLEELGLLELTRGREAGGDLSATLTTPACPSVSLADRVLLYQRLAELERRARSDGEALALEKAFLEDNRVEFDDGKPAASRLKAYKTLLAGQNALIDEKVDREVELGHEREFFEAHGVASFASRTAIVQAFVQLREQLAERDEADAMERAFLKSNGLWSVEQPEDDDRLDAQEQFGVRIQVFSECLEARTAEAHAKQQRETALATERAYLLESASLDEALLDSVQAPQYSRLRVFEQLLSAHRDAEAELRIDSFTAQEHAFLCGVGFEPLLEASSETDASAVRVTIYEELLRRVRDRDETVVKLERRCEQHEAALMAWNETPLVRVSELTRLESEYQQLLRTVASRDELLAQTREQFEAERAARAQQHAAALAADAEKRTADLVAEVQKHDADLVAEAGRHASEVRRLERAHDDNLARAAAASAKELVLALEKQAKQLEFLALVRQTEESLVGGGQPPSSPRTCAQQPSSVAALSSAQARALLLDKVTTRDSAAISMIYRSIRLATDVLNTFAFTRGGGGSSLAPSEIPVEVTQAVLNCVKELKALKEFVVESLEQLTRDEGVFPSPPPPFVKPNVDAAVAAGDTAAAIDFALCSHREFMAFANRELLTRQEAMDARLGELLAKLKAIASHDTDAMAAFTPAESTVMELEMARAREREARDNADCKLQLNDEYLRRLLDERKGVEAALSKALAELRDECRALRAKIDSLEQERYAQPPPGSSSSGSVFGLSPRATPMTPSYSNAMAPMRPERPRELAASNRAKGGAGSVHKERFVSDLEKETGQRRSTNTSHRPDYWKVDANPSSSQLEREFRAMDAASGRGGAAYPPNPYAHGAEAAAKTSPTYARGRSGLESPGASTAAPTAGVPEQELWHQGVRMVHHISFFVTVFFVPRQSMFRVELFNSDTEQPQTVYVTWDEMESFVAESKRAAKAGLTSLGDPSRRSEVADALFERVRVYGEGSSNVLLSFE